MPGLKDRCGCGTVSRQSHKPNGGDGTVLRPTSPTPNAVGGFAVPRSRCLFRERFVNRCAATLPASGDATRRTTMPYTLAAAAAATGLNKTTVLRAIKSGKISGSKNEVGEWQVEPAELHRVYPAIAATAESTDALQRDTTAPPEAELRLRASLAEQRLTDLKAALDDMRAQRDKWQAQAERFAGLLPDQRRRRSWWRRRPWWRRLAG